MMKTEPSSAAGGDATSGGSGGGSGNANLRSPSPHRNAYQAGLAALKQATDPLASTANGSSDPTSKPALMPRPQGRGRKYGSNVHRIKNMFMQMQSPGDEEDGAKVIGKSANSFFFPTTVHRRKNDTVLCDIMVISQLRSSELNTSHCSPTVYILLSKWLDEDALQASTWLGRRQAICVGL